jgi:hypothetical protein
MCRYVLYLFAPLYHCYKLTQVSRSNIIPFMIVMYSLCQRLWICGLWTIASQDINSFARLLFDYYNLSYSMYNRVQLSLNVTYRDHESQ